MSDTFNTFSTNTGNNGSFTESNSLVAKFSFLLLVIFMFILLLNVGISIISWLAKPSPSPKLINGMIDATQMITFTQDPSLNGSATIYRSNNSEISEIHEYCIKQILHDQSKMFYKDFKLIEIKDTLCNDFIRMEQFRR